MNGWDYEESHTGPYGTWYVVFMRDGVDKRYLDTKPGLHLTLNHDAAAYVVSQLNAETGH